MSASGAASMPWSRSARISSRRTSGTRAVTTTEQRAFVFQPARQGRAGSCRHVTDRKREGMITDKEVQAVKHALNRDWPEETTADQVARAAIKALDSVRGTAARPLNTPLRVGQAF